MHMKVSEFGNEQNAKAARKDENLRNKLSDC